MLLFLLFFSTKAQALSTHDFWIPQAKSLSKDEVAFDLRQQFTLDKVGGTPFHRSVWGLSRGFMEWGGFKVEAGLDWREPASISLAAALSAHGRILFNDLRADGWAVAVGVDQAGFHSGQNDMNINHLVFQNILGEYWEMAFGGFAGNSTFLRGDDKGMFVGLWRTIQNGNGSAGFEWTSGNSELGFLASGLKVEIRDGVVGYFSYGAANHRNIVKDWVSMRITILF